MRAWVLTIITAMLCACATTKPEREPERDQPAAFARLEGKSGHLVSGVAELRVVSDGVTLRVRITGASPGMHAVHLHEVGDCSAPDASSAGEHWNPTKAPHGHLMQPPSHLGDIGNMIVNAEGVGELEFLTDAWAIGTGGLNDVVGKALVIHEKRDDLTSQPAGDAGARIGCGVVTLRSHDAVSVSLPR